MSDQTFIFTFRDSTSYKKYKEEVLSSGGTIKHDLGEVLLGFTAIISPTVVELIRTHLNSFADNGITSFEPDSIVTIQA